MTEAEFLRSVIKLARMMGWAVYHTHDSRRSAEGFPDLVLAKVGRPVIFAELKTDDGEATAAQEAWLKLLESTPSRALLWRPSDLQEIALILAS